MGEYRDERALVDSATVEEDRIAHARALNRVHATCRRDDSRGYVQCNARDSGGIARSGLGHDEYRVPRYFVWRQRNRGRVVGARQLEGFASFLALGFASFLAPAISRKTNDCV